MNSKRKKILFVLHLPPPIHGSSMVGSFIKESEVISENFDSRFINLGTSQTIDEIGKNPISKIWIYIKIIFQVLKQSLFFRPNVVYIAMTAKGIGFYKDFIVAMLSKILGRRLVIHFHNKGVSQNQNKSVDNLLYRLVFRKAKVILLSKYLYNDIKKYVDEKNVFYCPNGIKQVDNSLHKISKEGNQINLLFLSNLIHSKGVYILLEALQLLKNINIKFHCYFVGGEGDISKEDFESRTKDLELDSYVTYQGKIYGDEKHDIFRKSDIFVHPSLNDCFPLVLLEALQFGIPAVATFEGAIPEIIDDNEVGLLVPKNDAQALAEKLTILIKDQDLRRDMKVKAYQKYINNYTLEAFEQKLSAILKSIN